MLRTRLTERLGIVHPVVQAPMAFAAGGRLAAACAADGDGTLRTDVVDVVRGRDWPARHTARVLANAFTDRWHGDTVGLRAAAQATREAWAAAWAASDSAGSGTFVGEATGMIGHVAPAGELLEDMARMANDCLDGHGQGHRTGREVS